MRLAAVQNDIAWQDPATSRSGIESLLDAAALPPGSLALLPELCDVGFTFDIPRVTPSDAPTWAAGVARRRGLFVGVGYPSRGDDGFGRNECAIARPSGELAPAYAKVHPFGVGRETDAYRGGDRLVLVEVGPFLACPLICYDLRFPELWRLATLAGANLFLVGASWPAARQHHWRSLLVARAIENQAFVVAANRVGADPSLRYGGGSIIVSPTGEVLAEGGDAATVISADCDVDAVESWRRKFPALRDVRERLLGAISIIRA
ncbi:MAG: nitrilase-related carbon-nitrogen hydrolase [Phycisphaerales bacterium]